MVQITISHVFYRLRLDGKLWNLGRSLVIVEELPQMRLEKVQVVRQAVTEGRRAYVLVNNRSEGNAPLTVERLVGILRG